MNFEGIKKLLSSDEYSFLRENECLKDRIMLLTLGGSFAYGTNIIGSDVDIRGITAEGPKEILGLSDFEQFENKETDTVIYGFRKIINLLLSANPNTLEILGTPDEMIFQISNEGKLLRDNVNLFLSQKAKFSFGGYANQQLRRLQNALANDKYPQPEKEKHILGSIINQMNHLQENYTYFTNEQIKLYIDKSEKEDFEKEIFMNINLNHYPLRDFKSIYSEMHNIVKEYNRLNHRNNKKDDLHLNKHSMHLIRLLLTAIDIFEKGKIITNRKNDLKLLMDIRNGIYQNENGTYRKEFFELIDDLEKKLEYAVHNTSLPQNPDYNKIEELVIEINKNLLKKYGIV